MTSTPSASLTVAIDTTSDVAGVALFDAEKLLSELTWYSRLSHSRDLLPGLEWLLERAGRSKADIEGVVVCLGPGSYAGMRVGISTAKALAYGLGAALAGVNRLEADAMPLIGGSSGRVVAVHSAGRAEFAWAAYGPAEAELIAELQAPALTPREKLPGLLQPGDTVVGDLQSLDASFTDAVRERGIRLSEAHPSRVVAVGKLGIRRLHLGHRDDPNSLAPLYLRAPAIGPQPPA
jgi:tRNA threonylcarbamoyladenosine biosynthesis protein TsaB